MLKKPSRNNTIKDFYILIKKYLEQDKLLEK